MLINILKFIGLFFAMMSYVAFAAQVGDIETISMKFGTSIDDSNVIVSTNDADNFYKEYSLTKVNNRLSGKVDGLPQGKVYIFLDAMDTTKSIFTSQPGDFVEIVSGEETTIQINLLAVDLTGNVADIADKPPVILSITVRPAVIVVGEEVEVVVKVKDLNGDGSLTHAIEDTTSTLAGKTSSDDLQGTDIDNTSLSCPSGSDDIDVCTITYTADTVDVEGLKELTFTTTDTVTTEFNNAEIQFSIQTRGSAGIDIDIDNAPIIERFDRVLDYVSDAASPTDDAVTNKKIEIKYRITDDFAVGQAMITITDAAITGFEDSENICNGIYSIIGDETDNSNVDAWLDETNTIETATVLDGSIMLNLLHNVDSPYKSTAEGSYDATNEVYTICSATLTTTDFVGSDVDVDDQLQRQTVSTSFNFFVTNKKMVFHEPYLVSSHQTSAMTDDTKSAVDFELIMADHISPELLKFECTATNGGVVSAESTVSAATEEETYYSGAMKHTFTVTPFDHVSATEVSCVVTGSSDNTKTIEFVILNQQIDLLNSSSNSNTNDYELVVVDPYSNVLDLSATCVVGDYTISQIEKTMVDDNEVKFTFNTQDLVDALMITDKPSCTVYRNSYTYDDVDSNSANEQTMVTTAVKVYDFSTEQQTDANRRLLRSLSVDIEQVSDDQLTLFLDINADGVLTIESGALLSDDSGLTVTPTTKPAEPMNQTTQFVIITVVAILAVAVVSVTAILVVVRRRRQEPRSQATVSQATVSHA